MKIVKAFLKSAGFFFVWLLVQFIVYTCFLVLQMFKNMIDGCSSAESEAVIFGIMDSVKDIRLIISGMLTLLIFWLYFKTRKKMFKEEACIKSISKKTVDSVMTIAVIKYAIIYMAIMLIPFPAEWRESYNMAIAHNENAWYYLYRVIGAPVVEEIIFRGLIYTRLKKGLPIIASAIITSLVFGLIHGQIIWGLYCFASGLLYVWIFEKYKSVTATIVCHMTFNAIGVVIMLLQIFLGYVF